MSTTELAQEVEAGRETDILVAERLTGQSRLECRVDPCNRDGEPQFHWGYPHGHDFAPNYSTDIAASWDVVERMKARGYDGQVHVSPAMNCYARFENATGKVGEAYGETPMLAICRAALKALEAAHPARA